MLYKQTLTLMSTELKVGLHMGVRETGEPVCFKHDGQRFEQSNTVKLNTNTEYELKLSLHPAINMAKLLIGGEVQKLELCQNNKDEYEDVRTYMIHYETTGYDVSKRGKRKEILFVIEFENGLYMKFSLQCKFYKPGETGHSQWGQKLASLDLDCRIEEGHDYVSVVKEKYF